MNAAHIQIRVFGLKACSWLRRNRTDIWGISLIVAGGACLAGWLVDVVLQVMR
jgi:hypothetical protein